MNPFREACFDANVLGAALCRDENNAEAVKLLDFVIGNNIPVWAPALCQFEVTGILNKKYSRRLMTRAETNAALEEYSRFPIIFLWHADMIREAYAIKDRIGCSYYDATYLATARVKNVPLVTDDREVLTKAKGMIPRLYSVREALRRVA